MKKYQYCSIETNLSWHTYNLYNPLDKQSNLKLIIIMMMTQLQILAKVRFQTFTISNWWYWYFLLFILRHYINVNIPTLIKHTCSEISLIDRVNKDNSVSILCKCGKSFIYYIWYERNLLNSRKNKIKLNN